MHVHPVCPFVQGVGRGTSMTEFSAAVLPLALATAASPVPLVVMLVLLLTPRAVHNGVAFTAGWAAALLVVGAGTFAVGGPGAYLDGTVVGTVQITLGIALIGLGGWHWARRPRDGSSVRVPRWLTAADDCTPMHACGLGIVLVVLNPKVFALTVAAAGTIAADSADAPPRLLALLAYAAVGTLGILVPLGLQLVLGTPAAGRLTTWRGWLVANGSSVTAAGLGAIGLLLLTRGVLAL